MLEADTFADLPDISEVVPFDPNGKHREIAKDFTKFLDKWDAWKWLGLRVLHSHRKEGFIVGNDELLVENTNATVRVQTLTPTALSEIKGEIIETDFRFFQGATGAHAACQKACVKMDDGSHQRVHNF